MNQPRFVEKNMTKIILVCFFIHSVDWDNSSEFFSLGFGFLGRPTYLSVYFYLLFAL